MHVAEKDISAHGPDRCQLLAERAYASARVEYQAVLATPDLNTGGVAPEAEGVRPGARSGTPYSPEVTKKILCQMLSPNWLVVTRAATH